VICDEWQQELGYLLLIIRYAGRGASVLSIRLTSNNGAKGMSDVAGETATMRSKAAGAAEIQL